MPVRLDGNIKIHGSVSNRCLGSCIRPVDHPSIAVTPSTGSLSQSTSSVADEDSSGANEDCSSYPSPINPGRFAGRIIRRIP